MPLTNMKLPKREEKTEATCAPCGLGSAEEYPYGLKIHLDTDQLEQLGIDKLPDVSSEVTIVARAKVTDVHQGASEHQKKANRHVSLQITDLSLEAPKPKKAAGDVFYSEGKAGEAD